MHTIVHNDVMELCVCGITTSSVHWPERYHVTANDINALNWNLIRACMSDLLWCVILALQITEKSHNKKGSP